MVKEELFSTGSLPSLFAPLEKNNNINLGLFLLIIHLYSTLQCRVSLRSEPGLELATLHTSFTRFTHKFMAT